MVDDSAAAPEHGPAPGRLQRLPPWGAVAVAALAGGLPIAGMALYSRLTPGLGGLEIVDVELGARQMSRHRILSLREELQQHLGWDLLFIALYGLGLFLGAWLLVSFSRSEAGRRWGRFGRLAAVVAVLADLLENAFLWAAIQPPLTVAWSERAFDAASVAAVIKFSALLPALVVLVTACLLTWGRAATHRIRGARGVVSTTQRRPALPVLADDPRLPVDPDDSYPAGAERGRWRRGYNVPECGHPHPGVHGRPTGICLSGGGIRAASVALGVLQAPEFRRTVVPAAQYLVSVSGGGYTSGAFQQNLTGAGATDLLEDGLELVDSPTTAFMPGTVEEDHVRRHSSYLAADPVELLVALGLLARHLLLTLVVLFGPAVLLGVAAGAFYRAVPLTPIGASVAQRPSGDVAPIFPGPRGSVWWALGILVVLAVAAWLIAQAVSARNTVRRAGTIRRAASSVSRMLAQLVLVTAVLTLALPAVIWSSAWLLHRSGGTLQIASPIGGVLLTYVASLASVAWKHRKVVTDKKSGAAMSKSGPRGAVQLILVVVTLIVLAASWLLVLGGMATVGLSPLSTTTWIVLGVVALLVLFLGGFSDETTLSLHPFYRGRLASAFAVRRVRRVADGETVARPYAPDERTVLSEYGVIRRAEEFPHVIFAAAATVGEKRAAPGGHRVSYTFCADWVGGPELGYVDSATLKELAPPRLQRDLTVQGAVALSGAAIAASIGGQRTAWYETLFVVTGLRLGAWMPNPAYLIAGYDGDRPWYEPRLPRVRRLSYLLRQLFGVHSTSAPLVQVTDGGFYDNLGLVELFRRGCTRIYCIDASGDNPPAATTLSQALTLAHHELGVETELERGTWSTFTVGSADPLARADSLAALSARMSQSGIITGTFRYPDGSRFAGAGQGVLVVAKSSLWPGLPYQVLAHAQGAGPFPRDSTGDQFFDDRQYAAYTALGRELGKAAVAAMEAYDRDGVRIPVPRDPAGGSVPEARGPNGDRPTEAAPVTGSGTAFLG
jgi:hypothetical protein